MVRTSTNKYSAWIAGYYDDFAIGRMVSEHGYNPASSQTYDHQAGHHGNLLNGMAPLNVRNVHSVIDRGFVLGSTDGTTGGTGTQTRHITQLEDNSAASNFGIAEYLKCDRNRLNKGFLYEGQSQPRRINNIAHQERIYAKLNTSGTNATYGNSAGGYSRFTNGYQTKSYYWVLNPGEHATGGRTDVIAFDEWRGTGANNVDDGAGAPSDPDRLDNELGHVVYASTASSLMWERTNNRIRDNALGSETIHASSASPASERGKKWTEQALNIGWPIDTLSGQPFLVLDSRTSPSRRKDGSASVSSNNIDIPLVTYEGSLNSRGDKDVFHVRMSYQAFMPHGTVSLNPEWGYLLKVGFISTASMSKSGWSDDRAAIELPIHAGTLSNTSTALVSIDSDEYVVLDGTNWAITGATRTGHTQVGNGSKKTEFTDTCNTVSGDATVVIGSNTEKLMVGMGVQGAGIPADATVASITNSTNFELSAAATATASGVTLTFDDMPKFEYTSRYLGTYGSGGVAVSAEADAGENLYLTSPGVTAAAAVKANLIGANVFQVETGQDVARMYDGGVGSTYSRPLSHPRFVATNTTPVSYYSEAMMDHDAVVADPGDDIWFDVDIELDYTNQRYHVFIDGKKIAFNRPFEPKTGGGDWSASDMRGWELRLNHYYLDNGSAVSESNRVQNHYDDLQLLTCIARASLYRPVTDNPDSTATQGILNDLKYSSEVNATSTLSLSVLDDNNAIPTQDIASASSYDNWSLILFAQNNIARPIWRGPIQEIEIRQSSTENTKTIKINASDPVTLLHRELPIWDFGEKSQADNEGLAALRDESNAFSDSLYMGVERLRETDDKIGFEFNPGWGSNHSGISDTGWDINMGSHAVVGTTSVTVDGTGLFNLAVGDVLCDSTGAIFGVVQTAITNMSATTITLAPPGALVQINDNGNVYRADYPAEKEDQRTRLWSSHPIQLYNNEDAEGPNEPEHYIDGFKIIGFSPGITSPAGQHVLVHTDIAHGLANGDTVRISGTRNYDGAYTVKSYNATDFLNAASKIFEIDLGSGNSWVAEAECEMIAMQAITNGSTTTNSMVFGLKDSTIIPTVAKDFTTPGAPFTFGTSGTVNGYFNNSASGNDCRLEYVSGGFTTTTIAGQNPVPPSILSSMQFGYGVLSPGDVSSLGVACTYAPEHFMTSELTNNLAGMDTTAGAAAMWPAAMKDYGTKLGITNGNWTGVAAGTVTVGTPNTKFFDTTRSWFTSPRQPNVLDGSLLPAGKEYQWWQASPIGRTPQHLASNLTSASGGSVRYLSIGTITLSFDTGYGQITATSGTTILTASRTPYKQAQYRAAHAVWMRDLPKSLWFKKQFGVINLGGGLATQVSGAYTAGATTITTAQGYSSAAVTAAASGVAEFVTSDGRIDSFCFSGTANDGGSLQLTGVKFTSLDHPSGTTLQIRDVSDDFKHIWVLWADMRNNGNADADGSTRKNKFGLLYPSVENYEVFLSFTDQLDIDGQIVEYTSLKIGEDFDMWEIDAEKEPFTGNSWSSLGSDSHPLTHFRNWEDKAGAFVVFDFSKFFNLNTEANGGRTGQSSGGRVLLEDLIEDTAGTPALIDDYWQEVCSTPANSDNTFFKWHRHHNHLFGVGSPLAADITKNLTTLTLDDVSEFPDSGTGFIEYAYKGTQKENLTVLYYISWTGRNTGSNTLTGVKAASASTIGTLSAAPKTADINAINQALASVVGCNFALDIDTTTNSAFVSATVYSSLSTKYALRFQMHLVGYVKTHNSNTLIDSDKARLLNLLGTTDHYLNHHETYTYFDINNMPITRRMTTTQSAVDGSVKLYSGASGSVVDWDSFGSVVDARDKSGYDVINEISQVTGAGLDNDGFERFIMVSGRDGRLDIRPTYQSYHTFTRDNLQVSNLQSTMDGTVSNVRLYYNGGASYIDHPGATLASRSKWKIMNIPGIAGHEEAKAIAQAEYEKHKESKLSIEAKILRPSADYDKMLDGSRYGYLGDTYRRAVNMPFPLLVAASDAKRSHLLSWTARQNSAAFGGAQNALDGNLGMSSTGTHGNGYGIGCATDVPNNDITESNQTGTVKADITWTDMKLYTYWGANSLSEALQVVHVEKGAPKASETTGNNLRACIAINHNATTTSHVADANEVEFVLYLIDPDFETDATLDTSSGTKTPGYSLSSKVTSANNISTLVFKHSGFHEITLPVTYRSTTGVKKMIVSLNTEYLRALLRTRCGDGTGSTGNNQPHSNANEFDTGINALGGIYALETDNPNSIFPLGLRTYPLSFAGLANTRALYYAPQIHIVDDINFYPGTAVTYTDANIGFSTATAMKITGVDWGVSGNNTENVRLTLDRDESRKPLKFANLLGSGQAGKNTGNSGGRGGAGGSSSISHGKGGQLAGLGGRGLKPRNREGSESSTSGRGGSITPQPRQPDGQRNVDGAGIAGGTEDLSGITMTKPIGVNNVSQSVNNKLMGKMRLRGQMGSLGNSFSILGQEKPGITRAPISSIEGLIGTSYSIEGRAFEGPDGVTFPGNTSSDDVIGSVSTVLYRVVVPENIASDMVAVKAVVSQFDPTNATQLITEIKCLESGASIGRTVTIPAQIQKQEVTLVDLELLNGAGGVNNTLEITIKRDPSSSDDDADGAAVIVHKTSCMLQRGTNTGMGDSSIFSPYGRGDSVV